MSSYFARSAVEWPIFTTTSSASCTLHRDLKPSNLYLSERGSIKIGDFGLATHPENAEKSQAGGDMSEDQLTQLVGTRLYMSPEQLGKLSYDNKVDIYSLGLILLEFLVPMSTDSERQEVFTNAKLGQYPSSLHHVWTTEFSWLELIKSMLHKQPSVRPTANQILRKSPKNPKTKRTR